LNLIVLRLLRAPASEIIEQADPRGYLLLFCCYLVA
jgi:hypothetical protein